MIYLFWYKNFIAFNHRGIKFEVYQDFEVKSNVQKSASDHSYLHDVLVLLRIIANILF